MVVVIAPADRHQVRLCHKHPYNVIFVDGNLLKVENSIFVEIFSGANRKINIVIDSE